MRAGILSVLGTMAACTGQPEARLDHGADRSLLLVVVDTLRADHVGVYGGEPRTPVMDRLAARGTRFARAYSHIPITGPSHATMFTGLLPPEHGVLNNGQVLDECFLTLAEVLRGAGRATGAVISLGPLKSGFGFDQGFDDYGDDFGCNWWKTSKEVTDTALAWLKSNGGQPYFYLAHYCDPHEPYAPAGLDYPRLTVWWDDRNVGVLPVDGRTGDFELTLPPGDTPVSLSITGLSDGREIALRRVRFVCGPDCLVSLAVADHAGRELGESVSADQWPVRLQLHNAGERSVTGNLRFFCSEALTVGEVRDRYRLEVEAVDREIGRLLESVRSLPNGQETLVALVADHGEGIGDHGLVGHCSQLYDTLVRVPFTLTGPGVVPAGRVVDAPVGLVDLTPTLLDILQVQTDMDWTGLSAARFLTAKRSTRPDRSILLTTFEPDAKDDLSGLIAGGWKYIVRPDTGGQELYDLARDPEELENLTSRHPQRSARLERALRGRLKALRRDGSRVADRAELSEEDVESLHALGYVQ